MKILRILLALTLLFPASPLLACTTVALRTTNDFFVGKSYDWSNSEGYVVINQAHVTKRAMFSSGDTKATPKTWTSLHNSVTFNQYGLDFANGGMNTQGLVVEMMEMEPSESYFPKNKEAVSQLQWVQHMLDVYSTVDEVVKAAPGLGIEQDMVPSHYMVCDIKECATIEYNNSGVPKITREQDMGIHAGGKFIPARILTNDHYDCSVGALKKYVGFGGTVPFPTGEYCPKGGPQCDPCRSKTSSWRNSNSFARFVRGAGAINDLTRRIAAEGSAVESKSSSPGNVQLAGGTHVGLDLGAALGIDKKTPGGDHVDRVQGMFDVLNKVIDVSKPPYGQGGTRWQIVYDQKNAKIYWRTNEDEHVVPPTRFTSVPRVIDLHELTGVGSCSANNSRMTPITGPGVNFEDYDEKANIAQVTQSGGQPPIKLDGFSGSIQKSFPWLSSADAETVVFRIWGGYPAGYTTCNGPVTDAQVTNLKLRSMKSFLNKHVQDQLPTSVNGPAGKIACSDTWCFAPLCRKSSDTKISWSIKDIKGMKKFNLTSITLNNGTFTFDADLGGDNFTGKIDPIDFYCRKLAFKGTRHLLNCRKSNWKTEVSMTGTGTYESQSSSPGNVCFKDVTLTSLKLDPAEIKKTKNPSCSALYDKISVNSSWVYNKVYTSINMVRPLLFAVAKSQLYTALKSSLPGYFPACPK